MRSPAAIIHLLIILGIGACSSFTAENSSGAHADRPRVYDVDEFLASQPAEYGEVVSIRGYLSTRQEDLHLYADRKAYKATDYNRCLNITFGTVEGLFEERKRYHRKRVIVTGVYAPIDFRFFHTGGCDCQGLTVQDIAR